MATKDGILKKLFTRSSDPSKNQSDIKGPVAATIGSAVVAGLGLAAKGKKGKQPIRTAIKNVRAKIEAKKDFKAQQKAMKEQTPAAPKFKAPKGSKVTQFKKTYGN